MNAYIPGDHISHDGQPAVVLCQHPDGRLFIRPEHGAGDLLVAAETCTSVEAPDASGDPLRLRTAE